VDSHLTRKQLAEYLAETTAPEARQRIARHLAACDECRKRSDMLITATAPRYRNLQPGAAVKDRVMRSWEQEMREKTGPAPFSFRLLLAGHPRIAVAASFAALAAAVTLGLFLLRTPPAPDRLALSADRVDGEITINDRPARPSQQVFDASTIKLQERAMARLTYGEDLSITLSGPGVFSIERFESDKAYGKIRMECTLSAGVLVSAVNGTSLAIAYAYNTPGARIEPIGTEFLLQAAGPATLVIMKQGSVLVKPVKTRETVTVLAGNRCVIRDTAASAPATKEDLGIFNDLGRLRTGTFTPRLLPAVTDNKSGVFEKKPGDSKPVNSIEKQRQSTASEKDSGKKPDENGNAKTKPGDRRERPDRQSDTQNKERLSDKRELIKESLKARRERPREQRRPGR
jgi:hypothetical protein